MKSTQQRKDIDFLSMTPYALVVSALLIAASVYIWFARGEDKFGIDYVGGFDYVVRIAPEVSAQQLRETLLAASGGEMFSNATIQSFDAAGEFSVRFSSREEAGTVRSVVEGALAQYLAAGGEILSSDFVGPTLGAELRTKAMWALIIGLIGITIYVTFRFEFAFAVGALVALFHDVIIATGVYLFFGHELNGAALAAALAIVGYSVNDTIVVFDRVREEIFKGSEEDFKVLLNRANNACLSRTIITSVLTLFSGVALLVFGGGAIRDLSVYLVVGTIVGIYSTLFIACPFVLWWDRMRERRLRAKQAIA